MSKKVFLGVSHASNGPGTAGFLIEKDVNLNMAIDCKDYLVSHDVEVKISRTVDKSGPLIEEINECNNFNSDLAIDIHNNSGVANESTDMAERWGFEPQKPL